MTERLLILGASARAAAWSALDAGLAPTCGDLFADADLAMRCPAQAARSYPADLAAIAERSPPGPWMYTGALENYPHLVERISRKRRLFGNSADTLRAVRDPFCVARALRESGLRVPGLARRASDVPASPAWLTKRIRSSGGRGIRIFESAGAPHRPDQGVYFQELVCGTSCAAIFVAAGGQGRLLGVTEQRLISEAPDTPPLCYAGSVGPLRLDVDLTKTLSRIGAVLAERFDLVGLFGVDVIVGAGEVWTIEVNPRYTASVELLERAGAFSAVAWHVAACREGRVPRETIEYDGAWHSKRVLFAAQDVTVTHRFTDAALQGCRTARPEVADIPRAGTTIQAGRPVMTVFAERDSRGAALDALEAAAQRWQALLAAASAAAR